jgi:hypothetical protein
LPKNCTKGEKNGEAWKSITSAFLFIALSLSLSLAKELQEGSYPLSFVHAIFRQGLIDYMPVCHVNMVAYIVNLATRINVVHYIT